MDQHDSELTPPTRIRLVEHPEGPTSTFIDVLINDDGDLVMEGQDVGQLPQEVFGDDDYEYWVTVPARYKDWLLLNLMHALFAENPAPSSSFMEWLKERAIPFEFSTW